MTEGWIGEEYIIDFAGVEIAEASSRYAVGKYLPGYVVTGLRGWDDLIVKDAAGQEFTVPAVPLDSSELASFQRPTGTLASDSRYTGKIKWYVTPVVFGGDPAVGSL